MKVFIWLGLLVGTLTVNQLSFKKIFLKESQAPAACPVTSERAVKTWEKMARGGPAKEIPAMAQLDCGAETLMTHPKEQTTARDGAATSGSHSKMGKEIWRVVVPKAAEAKFSLIFLKGGVQILKWKGKRPADWEKQVQWRYMTACRAAEREISWAGPARRGVSVKGVTVQSTFGDRFGPAASNMTENGMHGCYRSSQPQRTAIPQPSLVLVQAAARLSQAVAQQQETIGQPPPQLVATGAQPWPLPIWRRVATGILGRARPPGTPTDQLHLMGI